MHGPVPPGSQGASVADSTLPTTSCLRRFKVSRSLEEKHARSLDVVLAHHAVAAHATCAVLSDASVAAVGRHSSGANPEKPPA